MVGKMPKVREKLGIFSVWKISVVRKHSTTIIVYCTLWYCSINLANGCCISDGDRFVYGQRVESRVHDRNNFDAVLNLQLESVLRNFVHLFNFICLENSGIQFGFGSCIRSLKLGSCPTYGGGADPPPSPTLHMILNNFSLLTDQVT